jgi:hypothetical protein
MVTISLAKPISQYPLGKVISLFMAFSPPWLAASSVALLRKRI